MNEQPLTLFLYAETPLHVGTGSSLGSVDLPIMRERCTGIPTLPGSGLRGALREQLAVHGANKEDIGRWFGSPPPDPSDKPDGEAERAQNGKGGKKGAEKPKFWAGAVHLDDARLLLLPVRSLRHGWAWVTARAALDRLARDLDEPGFFTKIINEETGETESPEVGAAWVADRGALVGDSTGVLLEDIHFDGAVREEAQTAAKWIEEHCFPAGDAYGAFRSRVRRQLVILSDEDFKEFCHSATEVVARVRMDPQTHTVQRGALWTEELLPAESLLWSLAAVADSRWQSDWDKEKKRLKSTEQQAELLRQRLTDAVSTAGRIRIGGDQGIGRGRVALASWRPPAKGQEEPRG